MAKSPLIGDVQYIASGLLGNAASTGGLATVLLGLLLHFVIAFVIAAIFTLSATRLPILRQNAILGGLLYGMACFFVMHFLVLPLIAAAPLPFPLPVFIEEIINHALLYRLPLAIIARRIANENN